MSQDPGEMSWTDHVARAEQGLRDAEEMALKLEEQCRFLHTEEITSQAVLIQNILTEAQVHATLAQVKK